MYAHEGYYLCGKCDLWDAEVSAGNNHAKRDSLRYKCEAKHTSRMKPTQKKDGMGSYRSVWTTTSRKRRESQQKKKEPPMPVEESGRDAGIATLVNDTEETTESIAKEV